MSPRDRERCRQRIQAAAAELLAGKGPAVTMDAIARQAGVSRATLYRHFPRRAGLEQALAREGLYVPGDAASDRRAEILDAALRVLGRSGFSRLTMAAVAAEAGVSPAALYWHFTGKEALVEALLRRYSVLTETEGLAALPETGDAASQLAGLGRRLLQVVAKHGDVLAAVMAEAQGRPGVAAEVFAGGVGRVLRPLAEHFERGASAGIFRPGNHFARAQAFLALFVMYGLAQRAFGPLIPFGPEEAVHTYTDLFLHGIVANRGREEPG